MRPDHSRGSTTELGLRLGDWIWRRRERREDLQLAHLFLWEVWPMASQGIPELCDLGPKGELGEGSAVGRGLSA